jgi:hypothetical protein
MAWQFRVQHSQHTQDLVQGRYEAWRPKTETPDQSREVAAKEHDCRASEQLDSLVQVGWIRVWMQRLVELDLHEVDVLFCMF